MERKRKRERRPTLKPVSVMVRSVPLFQAEVGEGSSAALRTALPRVLASPGRGRAGQQKYLSFTEKVVSHTAHSRSFSWSGLVPHSHLCIYKCKFLCIDLLFHHLLHYMGDAVEMMRSFVVYFIFQS